MEGGINVEESQAKLEEHEAELAKLHTKIDTLKKFFVNIKKRWSKPKDRVIGFVRWAPPFGTAVPHRYTRDVCVIELYKDKFKHLLGNVLSLGAILVFISLLNSADLGFLSRPGDVPFEAQRLDVRSCRRPVRT